MLATLLHMLKGTPYIYQGEEFGMTNVAFDSIDKYRDIETLNAYRDYTTNGLLTHDEIFRGIHARGRDNSRTPVQWSAESQGGFTTGTPWIDVNPNYVDVNAEAARNDPDSLFHYYRQLIALRKQNPVVVYGKYELVLPEDESILAAGGIIVQLMPDASEQTIQALEDALKTFPPVSVLIGEEKTPEEMLQMLLGNSLEVLDHKPIQFNCTCSRDRMESAIIGLGTEEIRQMIEEDGGAEAVCHFCSEKYHFSAEQLEVMKQQAR
jgi:hypothetical protein